MALEVLKFFLQYMGKGKFLRLHILYFLCKSEQKRRKVGNLCLILSKIVDIMLGKGPFYTNFGAESGENGNGYGDRTVYRLYG